MPAESARDFDALEAQAERLMQIFREAGYERVAPAILQPAGLFLDRVGEDIRSRTYVFTDPDGNELCLRPDLTIPVCRIFLDRLAGAAGVARLAYNGPAFRYQRGPEHPMRPREFRQAGIECFGAPNRLEADLEVLSLALNSIAAAGLSKTRLKIGDIALFRGVIQALAIPQRWRNKLFHAYWHGEALAHLLQRLSSRERLASSAPRHLLANIDPQHFDASEAHVAAYLEASGIAVIGARSLGEITKRLMAARADLDEAPLAPAALRAVNDYLAISGSAKAAIERLRAFAKAAQLDISEALSSFEARVMRLGEIGVDADDAIFSADLGRRFEYYTGFVFEISAPHANIPAPLASGGRYDRLISAIGGPDVPAVGAAIYTERLLGAVGRGAA